MTKPLIRIRYVQGKLFYHLRNGLMNGRLQNFCGSMNIDDLYKQVQRDGVKFSEDKIKEA